MTKRLIELLLQREEMLGLPEVEYNELLVLLQEETKKTKETLDFYDNLNS